MYSGLEQHEGEEMMTKFSFWSKIFLFFAWKVQMLVIFSEQHNLIWLHFSFPVRFFVHFNSKFKIKLSVDYCATKIGPSSI